MFSSVNFIKYRIAGKFGGGKVWRIGHPKVLARKILANINIHLTAHVFIQNQHAGNKQLNQSWHKLATKHSFLR